MAIPLPTSVPPHFLPPPVHPPPHWLPPPDHIPPSPFVRRPRPFDVRPPSPPIVGQGTGGSLSSVLSDHPEWGMPPAFPAHYGEYNAPPRPPGSEGIIPVSPPRIPPFGPESDPWRRFLKLLAQYQPPRLPPF